MPFRFGVAFFYKQFKQNSQLTTFFLLIFVRILQYYNHIQKIENHKNHAFILIVMMDYLSKETNLKALILKRLLEIIDEKASIIKTEIQMVVESRDNETKSSVGDKYETTREMMQFEIEKNRIQLNNYELLKNEILKINPQKKFSKAEFGSLVFTAENTYFISIGLGKIEIENEAVYCISLISPIGKLLQNKKAGEMINFQGKATAITNII